MMIRHRILTGLLAFAFLSCFTPQAVAQSSPNPQQMVNWLNRDWIAKIWPFVSDTIANQALHSAQVSFKQGRARGEIPTIIRKMYGSRLNMRARPQFSLSQGGQVLELRFPSRGRGWYLMETTLDLKNLPDATIRIYMWIEGRITGKKATFVPHVSVHTSNVALTLAGWFGSWRENLVKSIEQNLLPALGFFSQMRWEPQAPFQLQAPHRELVLGEAGMHRNDTVDIVLVPDGFTTSELNSGQWDTISTNLARRVVGEGFSDHLSEPFSSFKSQIRIWRMNLATPTPNDSLLEAFIDPSVKTGQRKSGFRNLARLARIGIQAGRDQGAEVIVVVSKALRARALAFGNVVLYPTRSASGRVIPDAVLIHELGHTVLGGLADEYDDIGPVYFGGRPANRNVALKLGGGVQWDAFFKWGWWINNHPSFRQSWDQSVGLVNGGYYFAKGILRPTPGCAMRTNSTTPMCAVCREQITQRLRGFIRRRVLVLNAEYQQPYRATLRQIRASRSGTIRFYAPGVRRGMTRILLKVAGGSLPAPYQTSWRILGTGRVLRRIGRDSALVSLAYGSTVRVTISSRNTFSPRRPYRTLTALFRIVRPVRVVGVGATRNPRQTLTVGGLVYRSYPRRSLERRITLSAYTARLVGEYGPFTSRRAHSLEFEVRGPSTFRRRFGSGRRGGLVRLTLSGPSLRPGNYTWRVRSVYRTPYRRTLYGPWTAPARAGRPHFRIADRPVPPRLGPTAPTNVQAVVRRNLNGGNTIVYELSATTRSRGGIGGRPSTGQIRLEYELKDYNASRAWRGRPNYRSAWLSPRPANRYTVRGSVRVRVSSWKRWRVRAVDRAGRRSRWVTAQRTLVTGRHVR